MDEGKETLNKVITKGADIIKGNYKKTVQMILLNPVFYLILFPILLIIIIAGTATDEDSSTSSNTNGMSSVSGTSSGALSGAASGAASGALASNINLYRDDGTVSDESIQILQTLLENNYGLVRASVRGNNIGGKYNKENCERVTGTYLGFTHWSRKYAYK